MILTCDLGNSTTTLCFFENEEIIKKIQLKTQRDKNSSDYQLVLEELFRFNDIDVNKIEGIVISSAVEELTETIKETLAFLNKKMLVAGEENVNLHIKINKEIKEKVASDILMNVVAGKKEFKENFIIIDMGTVIGFNIVGNHGEYLGSVLTPGPQLGIQSLCEKCPQFSLKKILRPSNIIEDDLDGSLNAGVFYATIGSIKEIISHIKEKYKDIDFKVYSSGGLSKTFLYDLGFIDGIIPDITSKGLYEVWKNNS